MGNFFVVLLAHFLYADDRLNLGKVLGLLRVTGIALVNWQPGTTLSWEFSLRVRVS